jgi:hypothetical protein
MYMEFREDPLASVIEEIATLLATGYLRLRKARALSESTAPSALQATGERLDSGPAARSHGATTLAPDEKETDLESRTPDGN